jgi:hypothetical protein
MQLFTGIQELHTHHQGDWAEIVNQMKPHVASPQKIKSCSWQAPLWRDICWCVSELQGDGPDSAQPGPGNIQNSCPPSPESCSLLNCSHPLGISGKHPTQSHKLWVQHKRKLARVSVAVSVWDTRGSRAALLLPQWPGRQLPLRLASSASDWDKEPGQYWWHKW